MDSKLEEPNEAKPRVDTVPPSVKEHYFPDKEMPNISKDYVAIGFDADHALVKYDVKALNSLIARIHLQDLHECAGYPEDVMDYDCSEDSEQIRVCLNYSMFDIDNGTVLKLGEDNEVLAAMKGLKTLSLEEMQALYGALVPKYEHLEWPKVSSFPETEGANFMTL